MGYKDKYKNMGRSNLTFLNANGDLSHRDILANIQKDLEAELSAISGVGATNNARRAIAIANAQNRTNAENARYSEEKAKRMDDLFGNIKNVFTLTQTGLDTLGIKPPERDTNAPVKGQDSTPQVASSNTTLFVVGGLVLVLGIVGLVIYKRRN